MITRLVSMVHGIKKLQEIKILELGEEVMVLVVAAPSALAVE